MCHPGRSEVGVGGGSSLEVCCRPDAPEDGEVSGGELDALGDAVAEGALDADSVDATPGLGLPDSPTKRARMRAPATTRRRSRLDRERGRNLGTSLEDSGSLVRLTCLDA